MNIFKFIIKSPFNIIIWTLYAIIWIIATCVNQTIRIVFSYMMNTYYENLFKRMGVDIEKEKNNFYKQVGDISNAIDATDKLKEIIPQYETDPLKGGFNWKAKWWVTLLRQKYLNKEKHSYDCADHSELLRAIISHSMFGRSFEEIKIKSYLSIYKPVVHSHTILVAYTKDKKMYIFSPYQLLKVEDDTFKNNLKMAQVLEKTYNVRKPFKDCVKYLPISL